MNYCPAKQMLYAPPPLVCALKVGSLEEELLIAAVRDAPRAQPWALLPVQDRRGRRRDPCGTS